MKDYKPVVARLAALADILEKNRKAVLESVECLSSSTEEEDEAVTETTDILQDLCEEIEETHTVAAEILRTLGAKRGGRGGPRGRVRARRIGVMAARTGRATARSHEGQIWRLSSAV